MMWSIKYYDGVKAESHSAIAKINGNVLEIKSSQGQIIDHWPIQDISYDPNHLDQKFLKVHHEPDARIEIIDLQLIQVLPHLKKNIFNQFLTSKKILMIGILFIALIGIIIFSFSRPASRYLAQKISFETEKKMAEKLNYESLFSICTTGPTEHFIVSKMQARVEKNLFFKDVLSSVKMIKSPQSNAFTLPGGQIFITDELIRNLDSEEELLGVLAHELGHIHNRHVLQNLIRASFLTLSLNFFANDLSNLFLIDPNTLGQILQLKFDRELEHEADSYAVDSLKQIGIGSNGLIAFFDKMKNQSINYKLPEFLSTHPSDDKRIEFLNKYKTDSKLTNVDHTFKDYHCYE